VGRVSEALDSDAQIIWGAQISDDLKNAVRVMVILSGVHSPYCLAVGDDQEGRRSCRSRAGVLEVDVEKIFVRVQAHATGRS
jgi:cell division protein FtsZ